MLTLLLVALPLAGCAAVFALPEREAVRFSVLVTSLTLLDAVVLAASFDYDRAAEIQKAVDWSWVSAIGLRFHLGVDGISLPLVMLTALLTMLCTIYLLRPTSMPNQPRFLTSLLMLLEVGMIGTFVALDLLLFFVFFELVLLPMYAVIAGWGGPGRTAVAGRRRNGQRHAV